MTRFLQELSFTKIEKHIDLTIEQLSDYKGELFFFLYYMNFKFLFGIEEKVNNKKYNNCGRN